MNVGHDYDHDLPNPSDAKSHNIDEESDYASDQVDQDKAVHPGSTTPDSKTPVDKEFLGFSLPLINLLWSNPPENLRSAANLDSSKLASNNDKVNNSQDEDSANVDDTVISDTIAGNQDFYSTRKEQLQTFVNDLSNGFSLKLAFQKFKYLRTTSGASLKLPSLTKFVSDSYYNSIVPQNDERDVSSFNGDTENKNEGNNSTLEPSGVDPVVQPRIPPIVDEVIYPKTRKKKKKGKKLNRKLKKNSKRNISLSEPDLLSESDSNYYFSGNENDNLDILKLFSDHSEYIKLTDEEYKHPALLRKRILAITNITNLSDKHKGQLVQRLMLGRSYNGRGNKINLESSSNLSPMSVRINNLYSNGSDGTSVRENYMGGLTAEEFDEEEDEDIEEEEEDGEEEEEEDDDEEYEEEDEEELRESLKNNKVTGLLTSRNNNSDNAKSENSDTKNSKTLSPSERVSYYDEENKTYGCKHYQTSCKLQCPTCHKYYVCRNCHDAEEHTHEMSRKDVHTISCMVCGKIQPPAEECIDCENVFAEYFCPKCKLYDNDPNKNIYHCDDCGICRLGMGLGIDYYHCHGCNACISVLLENDHKCIENRTKCDCPICGDYMFTSKKKVVVMPCGHAIHQHCYDEYVKNYYKCPICSRTIINMGARFREIDNEIEMQPMPYPYNSWRCVITCNDCNTKSICKYHILGLKCDICHSYNTAQINLIKSEEQEIQNDGILSDEGITNTEFEEEEDLTTDDYARLIGNASQNNLLNSFFNDNSELSPSTTGNEHGPDSDSSNNGSVKNGSDFFFSKKYKYFSQSKNLKNSNNNNNSKNKKHKRGNSLSQHKRSRSRSNSLLSINSSNEAAKNANSRSFTAPVISNAFADNIRNIINSATSSTNNYYNDFIQATLNSLNDTHGDEEAFKDGDIINFSKINNLNINDFFHPKSKQGEQQQEAKKKEGTSGSSSLLTGKLVKDNAQDHQTLYANESNTGTVNRMPSLKEVLKKWANSTAGLSDSDDYEDQEEGEEEEDQNGDVEPDGKKEQGEKHEKCDKVVIDTTKEIEK